MQTKPLPNINVNLVINLMQDSFPLSAAKALRSITDISFDNALSIIERVEKYIDSCDPIVRNNSRNMRQNLEWGIRNELRDYISEYRLEQISQNYMMVMNGNHIVMTITYGNGQFCFTRINSGKTVFLDKEAALLIAQAIQIMSA
jgi:hypothetical protein